MVEFEGTQLAFQRVDGYQPPGWPGQQLTTPNRSTSTSTWTTLRRTRKGCSSLAGPCSSALTSCARTPTGGSPQVLAKGSQRPTLASHHQSQDARHRLEQLRRSPSPNLTPQPRNTRNPSMRLHQQIRGRHFGAGRRSGGAVVEVRLGCRGGLRWFRGPARGSSPPRSHAWTRSCP